MSQHWSDSGGFYEADSHDSAAFTGSDRWAIAKEVGILAGSAWGAGFLLSSISSYRTTKNASTGMPSLDIGVAEPGLDWIVATFGLLGGIFLGDWMGPLAQKISIGAGLGAASVIGVHWGAVVGHELASGDAKLSGIVGAAVNGVKGFFSVGAHSHHGRAAHLSPEAKKVLAEYEAQ